MEDQSSRRDDILDPNITNEGELAFEIEFPLSFPNIESQNDNDNEPQLIILKAFFTENENVIDSIRLQMFSDNDLYFFYVSEYSDETFNSLKESQSLDESLDFEHFPEMIHEIIGKVAEGREFQAKFVFDGEEKGKLIFSQKLKFKEVEILNLDFEKAKDEEIASQIQSRYDAVRNELKAAKAELNDLYTMLKIKNPNVLKQMRHRK